MAKQIIVQADTFGEGFTKTNENFTELYTGANTNITVERIPFKDTSAFDDSPLYYDVSENKIVSDVNIEVPGGTIKIGETTDLSSCTGSLIVKNLIDSKLNYVIQNEFNTTGSDLPNYLNLGAESILNIQTDFSQTLTANPLTYSLTGTVVLPSVRQVNNITFKTGAILTNLRSRFIDNATGVVMRYIPSKEAWDAGTGVTTVSGDNVFDFLSTAADSPGVFNIGVNPFIIENGQLIDIEIEADSINILGDLSGVPYQIADVQDGPYVSLATEGISGPVSSTDNTFPIWDGTTGDTLANQSNYAYNEFAFATDITLKPPNSSGVAAFVFNTSGGSNRGSFGYGQPGNELLFTVAAATAGGLRFVNNSAGNTVIDIRDTGTTFDVIGINHTAIHPLLGLATSSGDIDVYVGTPSPVGDLSAFGGSFYFRDAETNSNLYVKRSSGAASTAGWTAFGDVSSAETTTVINSIATWSNITGDTIQQADNCYAFTSGLVAGIDVDAPSTGTSEFSLRNSSSSDRFSLIYNETADTSLLLEQGANGLTIQSAVSDVNIISGSAKSVIINSVATITKSPVSAQLNLNLPSASGGGGVVITANTAVDTFVMTYSESSRSSFITATGTANDLTIQADVAPITNKVNLADTNPILSLANNTESIDLYAHDGDPNGVITSDEGDIVVDKEAGEVQIYQRHGSGSGNSYAQVEFLQKQWLAIGTSQTLSRDYNRILLDPVAGDIALVIPTPANTAQARGFEQTLVKTTNNDDVVKFTNPGFILGATDTYIMSKYGDSMTYMQTTSRNIMLHETRDPYAIMSRGGSAELSIDGATGANILLEGFTSNDHFYYGLCEPNQANDKIQFVNVEDLTNGDLYEINLSIVGRWTKDYDIKFRTEVDDKGLKTEYDLHILETSASTTDYQQLNGQGFFRTGINTLGGLDTFVQIVFRLDTAATFWVRTINLQIRKIRG